MKRPDRIIGKGKQDFVVFNPEEQKAFNVPAGLTIEESVVTARSLLKASTSVHASGLELLGQAEAADPDDIIGNLQGMEGETRKRRAEALGDFAGELLHLCDPELRAGLYPETQ